MCRIFTVTLLFWVGSVNAALIDSGSFTTDTASELDWLDLTATIGMSYTDALAANGGWRYATNSEVENLFSVAFNGYYDTNPNHFSNSVDGAYVNNVVDASNFISLFGETLQTPVSHASYGFYFDEDNIYRMMGAFQNESSTQIVSNEYVTTYTGFVDGGATDKGVYLVRSSVVPIPAAAWLFGSALAGLGWFRRKA
jgi:hypothetical protein